MGRNHRAPWSRTLIWLSVGVTLILIGVSALAARNVRPAGSWVYLCAVLGPILVVLLSALFTVRGYEIDGALLRVRRLVWNTVLSLDGLRAAEANSLAMKRSLRLFGNGGLFSFSGLFSSKELGRYRAYVTDPARSVVLKFGDQTIVVSPEEPEVFARQLRELRRLPESSPRPAD